MSRKDHRDVQLAFYQYGVSAIEKMIDTEEVSSHTVRRAFRSLEDDGAEGLSTFEQLLRDRKFIGSGLTRPDVGDIREYKVQESESGEFLRLPVGYLGVKSGDMLRVRFFASNIRVESMDQV